MMNNSGFEVVEPAKFSEPNHSNVNKLRDIFKECWHNLILNIQHFQDSKVVPNFCQDILHIDPVEGHVWPKSSMVIKITFQPNEPGEHNKTIYCDVEGRESRLPLTLKGNYFYNQSTKHSSS